MRLRPSRFIFSAALLVGMTLSTMAFAAELDFPHIRTSGYGEVNVIPDSALLSVRAELTADSAEEAKQQVDRAVDAFLEDALAQGIKREDIKSSNLHIAPQYRYPKEAKPELFGYRATRTMTLTILELEQLDRYLEMAMKSGINRVDNIQLQTTKYQEYKQQALSLAIKDAQMKAHTLAAGFEQQIEKVWQINYQQNQPRMMRSLAMDSAKESGSYADKVIAISDKVDVVFKMSN
ncbi:SIMPL domain-containing protein [Vibrio sp. FNV 38]|nr:SIMPL domain-containing protein [Vibrio sp. FNV 38]